MRTLQTSRYSQYQEEGPEAMAYRDWAQTKTASRSMGRICRFEIVEKRWSGHMTIQPISGGARPPRNNTAWHIS